MIHLLLQVVSFEKQLSLLDHFLHLVIESLELVHLILMSDGHPFGLVLHLGKDTIHLIISLDEGIFGSFEPCLYFCLGILKTENIVA